MPDSNDETKQDQSPPAAQPTTAPPPGQHFTGSSPTATAPNTPASQESGGEPRGSDPDYARDQGPRANPPTTPPAVQASQAPIASDAAKLGDDVKPATRSIGLSLADWRNHRFTFITSLICSALLGHKILPMQPAGTERAEIPPSVLDELKKLVDEISKLPVPSFDQIAEWIAFYNLLYALVRGFFSRAPGITDQETNAKLHALSESLNHGPVMADLCKRFIEQTALKGASTNAEAHAALADVITGEHSKLLEGAGMRPADVMPLLMVAAAARQAMQARNALVDAPKSSV